MLPDKAYVRHYIQNCDNCSDGEFDRCDSYSHWADCGGNCGKELCEDCVDTCRCVVCEEAEEFGYGPRQPAMCRECTDTCEQCNISFHSKCREEHVQRCNSLTCAQRALSTAIDHVRNIEYDLEQANRRVAVLQEELEAARAAKTAAENSMRRVSQRG